jgi:cell wall-associated NlpC family hydrolase
MAKQIRLASLTSKWVGSPYKEYGNTPKEGCDCFSFILNMFEEYGIKIPDEFDGFTKYNYMDLWYNDRDKAIEEIDKFLISITTEKELNRMRSGDMILVKHRKIDAKSFMMYAGNSKAIIVNDEYGVIAMPIREFEVIKVYRGFH